MKKAILLIALMLVCGKAFSTDYCSDSQIMACWRFTDGSGTTLTDNSTQGKNGTFKSSGHPSWSTAQVPRLNANSVLYGDADTITFSSMTPKTIVFWTYSTDANSPNYFLGSSGSRTIQLDSSGKWLVYDGSSHTTSVTLPSNTSVNVAFVYNTTSYGIYQSGTFQSNVTSSNIAVDTMGRNLSTFSIHGYISEVAFFNRSLNSTEVNDIKDNGLSPALATTSYTSILGQGVWDNVVFK